MKPIPPPLNRLISGGSVSTSSLAQPPAGGFEAHLQERAARRREQGQALASPMALESGVSSASTVTPGAVPGPSTSRLGETGSISASSAPNSVSTAAHTPAGGSSAAVPSDSTKARAKDDASRAAKSFRVTLEDPCFKVLPAALKKYKINDDWRQYALFICFGSTGQSCPTTLAGNVADGSERCLSYDEKPLMLFQKLKESGQKPVFMLRHIVRAPTEPA